MIISAIIAKLWPLIAALIAAPIIYWRGKHNGKVSAHRKTLESYQTQRKAADNADTGIGASDAARWLRERGQQ